MRLCFIIGKQVKNNEWVELLQNWILIISVVIVVILGMATFTQHARELQHAVRETNTENMPVTAK